MSCVLNCTDSTDIYTPKMIKKIDHKEECSFSDKTLEVLLWDYKSSFAMRVGDNGCGMKYSRKKQYEVCRNEKDIDKKEKWTNHLLKKKKLSSSGLMFLFEM